MDEAIGHCSESMIMKKVRDKVIEQGCCATIAVVQFNSYI